MRRAGKHFVSSLLIASPLKLCFLLLSLLFLCAYWAVYWCWLVPFLNRASEGMRMRLLFPSHYMQSRIHDYKDPTSTSTSTNFGPSPTPYDGWHTLFDFFYCSPQAKPPPWPSFPARLFPTLCMCFLVHMWFYNLILRCRGFSWDVWKFCSSAPASLATLSLCLSLPYLASPLWIKLHPTALSQNPSSPALARHGMPL